MKIHTFAKIVTFAALFSWLCAGLLGLHSHIPLDGGPATLDASLFKDALDDSYGHESNPHVDSETSPSPAKYLNLAILMIAGLVILAQALKGFLRSPLTISFHPQAPQGLRPPLRAPPRPLTA